MDTTAHGWGLQASGDPGMPLYLRKAQETGTD